MDIAIRTVLCVAPPANPESIRSSVQAGLCTIPDSPSSCQWASCHGRRAIREVLTSAAASFRFFLLLLLSSSSSSSSSSLVYHPLRKGSRREVRTPSFISISQAVECCKGIQNFFFFFFFFFLLLLALCLSSLLAASVGSGLSIEVTIRWLAVTVRSTKNPIIFIFIIIIIIFFFISMPHSLPT